MKNLKFLIAILAVVMLMASCATTENAYGDERDEANLRRVGNRVYVDDPYYGTVVLERDPVTGRYFDVTNGFRGYGIYGSPYNAWNTRGNRNNGYYRNNGGYAERPAQQQAPGSREEARKKILGN